MKTILKIAGWTVVAVVTTVASSAAQSKLLDTIFGSLEKAKKVDN